jgi:hypothetical protein
LVSADVENDRQLRFRSLKGCDIRKKYASPSRFPQASLGNRFEHRRGNNLMLVCGCGRWMHTEGVVEREDHGEEVWLVRSECQNCQQHIGVEAIPQEARSFVDRLVWSDEAGHQLSRMPPYVQTLMKPDVEQYAQATDQRVVTLTVFDQARRGGSVSWEPDAEQRLANVPAAVRAMARVELERTAMERGHGQVTVALMEEIKARYFGMRGNI